MLNPTTSISFNRYQFGFGQLKQMGRSVIRQVKSFQHYPPFCLAFESNSQSKTPITVSRASHSKQLLVKGLPSFKVAVSLLAMFKENAHNKARQRIRFALRCLRRYVKI